jgi:Domain of unknown function (DUF4157)
MSAPVRCALPVVGYDSAPAIVPQGHRETPGLLRRASISEGLGGAEDPFAVVPPVVGDVVSESGRPLDGRTRAVMESRLGHDFAGVRVHTDAKAAGSARAVNARAYTVGQDVVFDTGRYAPGTPSGDRLLTHELVHTVQHGNVPDHQGNGVKLGLSDDASERQARRVTEAVTQGPSARPPHAVGTGHARGSPLLAASTARGPILSRETNDDADAQVSLGPLDNYVVDSAAEEILGETTWKVLREFIRGVFAGLRSAPPEQLQRILDKFDDIGIRSAGKFLGGYALGILEGLFISLKGLFEAVITLIKLPFEFIEFLAVKVPELAARYGPRIVKLINEDGGIKDKISKIAHGFAENPRKSLAQIQTFLEAAAKVALGKVRAMGRGAAGKLLSFLEEPWFEYGLDIGKVVGQILFEVALALASEGIANVVKEALSVLGRVAARAVAGAVELIKTTGRLIGEAIEWVGRLGRGVAGEVGEMFEGVRELLTKLRSLFAELGEEGALADTGTGVNVPVPKTGPTVLESRAIKPPPRTSPATVADLTPPKVHPSNLPKDVPAPKKPALGKAPHDVPLTAAEKKLTAEQLRQKHILEDVASHGDTARAEVTAEHGVSTAKTPGGRRIPRHFERGQLAHEYAELLIPESKLPRGLRAEVTVELPGGSVRLDRVDFERGVYYEIKPNTKFSKAAGAKQIRVYEEYMNANYPLPGGQRWVGRVVTYKKVDAIGMFGI